MSRGLLPSRARARAFTTIGRLMPETISIAPGSRNASARFDGVPPNMSVRSTTPFPRFDLGNRLFEAPARGLGRLVPRERQGAEVVGLVGLEHVHGLAQRVRERSVRQKEEAHEGAGGRRHVQSSASSRCETRTG